MGTKRGQIQRTGLVISLYDTRRTLIRTCNDILSSDESLVMYRESFCLLINIPVFVTSTDGHGPQKKQDVEDSIQRQGGTG